MTDPAGMHLVHDDDRATYLREHDERYVIGPVGSPLLTLNAADTHGCAWVAEVDGWHAPDVTTPLDRRPDGHGGYVGASSFDPLSLAVDGMVTAPSRAALRAARGRFLRAVLGDLTGLTRYTHLDDDPAKGVWVRVVGQPKWREWSDRAADFAVVLLAEDPIKTGEPVTYGPVRLAGTAVEGGLVVAGGGLTVPLTVVGGTSSTVVALVRNDGDEPAHAVYRVTGPVPQPLIQLSSGEFVHLRLDLASADTLTVDTAAGVVEVNGVVRYDAWGPGSTFPLIPGRSRDPVTGELRDDGGAEVRLLSFTGGADPAAALYIDAASSWR